MEMVALEGDPRVAPVDSRLSETVKLVREAEVPAPVWRELKAAGLIPADFPTS